MRKETEESFKNVFNQSPSLVAPFDRKLLHYNDGEVSNQVPALVSGKEVEKLLGIPKISFETYIEMKNSMVELFTDWYGFRDFLKDLCFDRSVNIGIPSCAITVVQNTFKKHVLFFSL